MRHTVISSSVLALIAGLALHGGAFAAPRVTTPLAEDWRFLQGDPAGAEATDMNDSAWKTVSVPHDWQIAGPFNQQAAGRGGQAFLPTGVAWYRKTLDVKPEPGRRYFVELDGVMERSGVWINGQHVGYRPSGYVSLRYDITPFLRADGKNVLAVRADTSAAPSSRWYAGGGIYRNARLIETSDVYIDQGGAFVMTPTITANAATVAVSVDVVNTTDMAKDVKLEVVLTGPDGREAGRMTTPLSKVAAGRVEVVKGDLRLANPHRWNLDDPALYKASIKVVGADDTVLDDQVVKFGVREATFDPKTGFSLNGKNFKLKGVALHHDGGAVGAAVPLDVWRDRLKTLKSLGVNAIRTAHNVPAPEFLDLTDEMGFIVMDEFFDQWNVAKTPNDYHLFFGDWHKRDTRDMVRRDRNHPSIVLWSMGNEIHDTQYPDQAKAALKSIIDVVHANDPSRPATMALFRPNVTKDYDNGLADMLDVVGQNYREQELIAANKQNPERKIIGTENTHNRSNWLPVRDYPAYSGMFIWTGVDYLGESIRWPNIGQDFGFLDRSGEIKRSGYEHGSWWAEKPVVFVVRNSDPSAAGPPTDDPMTTVPSPTGPGTPAPVVRGVWKDWTPENLAPHNEAVDVYSNCQSVELLLNGRSLGAKPIDPNAAPRRWNITFVPGEVRAVCKDAGAKASDSIQTAGAPAAIQLVTDKKTVGSSFDDIAFVRARVVDAKGVVVPRASDTLRFKVSGTAALVATDNGALPDQTPFTSPERNAYLGKAVALVRGDGAGTAKVEVEADGLKPGVIELNTVK